MQADDTRLSWNGLAAGGGLLLALDRAAWPLREAGVLLDGLHFEPKRELHVTLLTRAQAQTLAALGVDPRALRLLAEPLQWSWRARDEAWRLRRQRDGSEVQSLIVRIDMPAQSDWRHILGERFGVDLGEPVPHLTLYTLGDPNGISVPNRLAFEALRMERVSMRSLRAT
ncbi:MAG TPA: hypothetical protein PKZ76_08655 [Xanthomonadaceae bacterium]|nr:hypothetical protein [Xanthomonadaceae bacterium]